VARATTKELAGLAARHSGLIEMPYHLFLIGVLLAVITTSETMILLGQLDRKRACLTTLPRWRVLFSVAVILGGILGILSIGGYHA
jgi:hypothetical protein